LRVSFEVTSKPTGPHGELLPLKLDTEPELAQLIKAPRKPGAPVPARPHQLRGG
jgi:hypothetical protein